MTVPSSSTYGTANGNGVATTFNLGFDLPERHVEHVVLTFIALDGATAELAYLTDYTIDPVTDQFTFPAVGSAYSVLAFGERIDYRLVAPLEQDTDLTNQGGFYPEDIEKALDDAVYRDKTLQEQIDRSVRVPVGSELDPNDIIQSIADAVVETDQNAAAAAQARDEAVQAKADTEQAKGEAEDARDKAQEWAENPEDVPVEVGKFSALHWASKAEIIATTGDYVAFGPVSLTLNQALGTDPIVLPADPKIAARVDFVIGGVPQQAGTSFTLDADPNTTNLRIVGGTSSLEGVSAWGCIQLPSSLTPINAPSAGSVTETAIQNGAVTFAKVAEANVATVADITNGAASKLVQASELSQLFYSTQAYNANTQAIPNGAVPNVLTLPNENWDDGNWHSPTVNNHRITVDFTGRVRVTANGIVVMPNTTGYMKRELRKNGVSIISSDVYQPANNGNIGHSLTAECSVVPGDYFDQTCFGHLGATSTVAGSVTLTVTRIK